MDSLLESSPIKLLFLQILPPGLVEWAGTFSPCLEIPGDNLYGKEAILKTSDIYKILYLSI